MTSYNVKSAHNHGWNPKWFSCKKFGSELVENIEEFQKKNGLNPDGFCGPKTVEVLRSQRKSDQDYIVCGMKHIKIKSKVVLWNDEGGYAAKKGCYREDYSDRDVRLFVNHWDVCRKSSDTIKILNNRKLSSQFLIDADGTIYQAMNANHVAWHAGGRSWNNYSIGVEICNPYYLKYQDKTNPRKIIKGAKVHGRTLEDHLDFYPAQIKALLRLWKGIHIAYGIPFQTPTKKDGSEYGTNHPASMSCQYRGYVHHYNLVRSKVDCGGLDLTKLIDKITK